MPEYYVVPTSALTATADAIKEKTGSSETIEFTQDGFADAIAAIPTGGTDTLEAYLKRTLQTYENESITSIIGQYALANCTSLTSVKLPNATALPAYCFYGDTGLTVLVFPKLSTFNGWQVFNNVANLTKVDILGPATIPQNAFAASGKLSTLILRRTAMPSLTNINAFNNTPFASGKAGGTMYVPSALISSYQEATNWSTVFSYGDGAQNQILPIEGSIYETQYADGTPIT